MAGANRPVHSEPRHETGDLVYLSLIAVVASLGPNAHAQTFSVIHAFSGLRGGADGAFPEAGVTLRPGYVYGTANYGPTGNGVAFRIPRVGDGWGELEPLANFYLFGGSLGSSVVFGPDGHIYGTANGSLQARGWIFDLMPPAMICDIETPNTICSSFWKQTLHRLTLAWPSFGALVFDQQGNIYGTAQSGPGGETCLYQIMRSGKTWTENLVHCFSGGEDGGGAGHGVIIDSNGNLIGTTANGGLYDYGTVFEFTHKNGQWVETILHNFQLSDGVEPGAGLISDSSGNLYGATTLGGSRYGGTVFELVRSGDTYTFQVLYDLGSGSLGGPQWNLAIDSAGNLYGTTGYSGGLYGQGNIFRLAKTQNGWVYTSLHDFTGGSDGSTPVGDLTIDEHGDLYGVTVSGGDLTCNPLMGCGTVWVIKP